MTVETQQKVTLMFGGTLCLCVLLSISMLGAYGLKYDGQVAEHILSVLQTIVITVVPSLAGLGGLHIVMTNRTGAASAPAPAFIAGGASNAGGQGQTGPGANVAAE